ncbi:DUF4185 domain-containing protein [Thermodesulfobacteriota bacterium]
MNLPWQISTLTLLFFSVLQPGICVADAGPSGVPTGNVTVCQRATKISQIVGEYDRERKEPTLNRTFSRFGLAGTDLGVPFRHKERTYFVFGDTYGVRGGDPIAYSTDNNPEDGLQLHFIQDCAGIYKPVTIDEITQGAYEVPMEGMSVNGKMYVYHTTDRSWKTEMGRSIVAVSEDDGRTFDYLYDLSNNHFINVSIVRTEPGQWKGLPPVKEPGLIMFGTGAFRKSNVRLAFQPAANIESPETIRYFVGLDPAGRPRWSPRETDAIPLFNQPCIGELSVSYNRFIKKWIMLYNCFNEGKTILMRTADRPWGPWSEPQIIFDPEEDAGFCRFMHLSWKEKKCDALHEPGKQNESGLAYGPYQLEEAATGNDSSTTIYFTLSTWNPYTVVLMKATICTTP